MTVASMETIREAAREVRLDEEQLAESRTFRDEKIREARAGGATLLRIAQAAGLTPPMIAKIEKQGGSR